MHVHELSAQVSQILAQSSQHSRGRSPPTTTELLWVSSESRLTSWNAALLGS